MPICRGSWGWWLDGSQNGGLLGWPARFWVVVAGSEWELRAVLSGKEEVFDIWRAISTSFMSSLTFSGSSSTFSATYNEMLIETASKQTHTEMVSGIISKIQLFNSMTTWTLQGTIYNINLTLYKQHLLYRALWRKKIFTAVRSHEHTCSVLQYWKVECVWHKNNPRSYKLENNTFKKDFYCSGRNIKTGLRGRNQTKLKVQSIVKVALTLKFRPLSQLVNSSKCLKSKYK